jgi:hypothetical protein
MTMDDDLRDVPLEDGQDSVNDEFAPVISPDPAIPPERDPLAGQPFPERDETGPYGLDREATESVETDTTGGGMPASEYAADERMRTTDAGREDSAEAWPESRGGMEDPTDKG